ncbi:energy transducer TonB [Thalassotalea ponticola]|uniref:energy transducer TonB n=1 Tax=Thalassotalea ponticola TaxID=1523392 RepID=UPI0025B44A5C|nr:energy transducer TonB [Thalassotalea ponticola]MDN3653246.1 energy transducer TonB [Thalassotalea ponticola]
MIRPPINFLNALTHALRAVPVGIVLMLSLLSFNTFGGDVTDVSVVKRALPVYPKYAIKNGLEGSVLVNFSIEKDGNVSDIQVVASDLDGLFDATTILGIQKWVYTKSAQKHRNQYVVIEFALSEKPVVTQYANVERIRVRAE